MVTTPTKKKRTYKKYKDYATDITYENEVDKLLEDVEKLKDKIRKYGTYQ